MMRSKITACFLCLTLLASAVSAQDNQPHDSDRLKQKIEEVESAAPKSGTTLVNLTYKRILLRRYDQYIFSLQQDIEDLRKIRTTLDENESDGIKEIDADIERLTKEHVTAVEKARLLRAEAQVDVVTLPTHHPSSQGDEAKLPCICLTRAKKREKEKKGECKTEATAGADKKDKEPVGVFWCRKAATYKLSVQELAERVAPILWFSPDEPLLKEDKHIPEKLLGNDSSVDPPMVYYRISHLVLNPSAPLSYKPDLVKGLDLTNIKKLTLKYYFYYSKDEGFKPHTHDLESARFDVHFTLRDEKGKEIPNPSEKDAVSNSNYYVAYISRVVGAAHGVSWFDNILDIEKHTSLPITILVEEGKHSSCPDRNADGVYSPGYDVNHRFNDAWGVRDIMATGEMGGVRYDASKTKPRKPQDMIMVAPDVVTDDLLRFYGGSEENQNILKNKQGYKLKLIDPELGKKLEETVKKEAAELGKEVDEKTSKLVKDIGKGKPKISPHEDIFWRAVKFGYGIERKEEYLDALTVSYRFDGGHGFSFSPPIGRFPIPVVGGYVLPKANLILFGNDRRYSLEALYAPSAARSIDWYASIGSEWLRLKNRDPDAKRNFDAKFASEGGIRFRINQGPFLLGGRVGLRTTGRDQRVVFEIGAGAF